MSVIIEALKKLNSESVAANVQTGKPRPQNKRPASPLSPVRALLYSVILLILISALLSGFTYMTRQPRITNAPDPFSLEKEKENTTGIPDAPPKTAEKKASADYQEALLKPAAPKSPPVFQPKVSGDPEINRSDEPPFHQQETAAPRTTPAPEEKKASSDSQAPHIPDQTDLSDTTISAPPYITEGEKLFLANREKSLQVEKLVHRIERAIAGNDPGLVPPLLEKLERLKGKEDAYVLKLKAFWLIRQNNYQAGARHLEKVLKKNRDDLEAGINMAVIEIHTHQLRKALARLTGLKRRHPDNPLVHNLILKVKQSL